MGAISERLPDGNIVLDVPVKLPAVLDLLIVGGGPLGTACAFRAKELGLAALVIETDDLMKRIRDYEATKPIKPDYGGGDTMEFPAGGELVNALRFPEIKKDQMVAEWKALYRKYSVPAKVGVELLQLERRSEGVWRAIAKNHYTKETDSFLAKNVVLGLGRGVPRRLDIPGDVQDLAVRLMEPRQFVGSPACVIGGGTSAAEAVIAISNAKVQSEDSSPVYWSYRGQFMPKVSQALAGDLFEVMIVNGNLRMALGSEPVAMIKRNGGDFLAICTEVTEEPSKPRQVTQLEFAKAFCVACIGADRPDALLKTLGADFIPTESGKDDRIVVSALLETCNPGVFLGGDLLSPSYAIAADFDANPAGFVVQPRRGNIKAAMRDGVLLAEIVRQRLDGKQDIRVVLASAPPVAPDEAAGRPALAASRAPVSASIPPRGPSGPGRLVALLADGTPADEFSLVLQGTTTIGRAGATITFPEDTMLSDRHAAISHGPAGLELRDLDSQNGVFVKVQEGRAVTLSSGTIIKAGRQWLVSRATNGSGEIVHYDYTGREVGRYRVPEGTTLLLGRTAPATVLDGSDSTLSRRHLSISADSGSLLLRDLGSRNGTFVKVDKRWTLQNGDLIWLGNQLLRVLTTEQEAPAPAVIEGKVAAVQPAREPPPVTPAAPPLTGASVTFGPGKTYAFGKSGTLLDLALAKRIRIKFECKVGDCGKCRVVVTSGGECLNPRSALEEKALRMVGHGEPENRLACLVTAVTCPVAVDVPK